MLLWAIGALAGWLLLRNWTQAALLALLVPAWLAGEWEVRTESLQVSGQLMLEGLLLLAITYFTARTEEENSPVRRALVWVGGIALLPLSILAFVERHEQWWGWANRSHPSTALLAVGWAIAICAPLALALILRGMTRRVTGMPPLWVRVVVT